MNTDCWPVFSTAGKCPDELSLITCYSPEEIAKRICEKILNDVVNETGIYCLQIYLRLLCF